MSRVKRLFDYELIREIMTNRHIYKHITDDGCPSAQDFSPQMDERIIYLGVFSDDDEIAGIFMLHPHNTVCYEVHTCMLPKAWGALARDGANETCKWMFKNTPCERIITNVPSYNHIAKKFSIDCGLIKYGINQKSIKKNGILHDQYLYGISKGNWLCQQQYQ